MKKGVSINRIDSEHETMYCNSMALPWIIRILLAIVALTILVLSLIPDLPPLFEKVRNIDKAEHAAVYMVLGFLVFMSFKIQGKRRFAVFIVTLLVCFSYGLLIEILQTYAGRNKDMMDFGADAVGSIVGSITANFFPYTAKKQ